jgi:hypothetical protein
VSLLTELDAFFTDHHDCGDFDAGVDGPVVWMVCDCGAVIVRQAFADTRGRNWRFVGWLLRGGNREMQNCVFG